MGRETPETTTTTAWLMWTMPAPWKMRRGWLDSLAHAPALVEAMGLPQGLENGLLAKLNNAQVNLDKGDLAGAQEKLLSFLDQVAAQRGKKLTEAQADLLTTFVLNALAQLQL